MTEMHISKETEMDEYTFLVLAKLKADRLRLAREARATLAQPERQEARNNPRKHSRHARVVRDFEWREQS
jgi:hypothetical protein